MRASSFLLAPLFFCRFLPCLQPCRQQFPGHAIGSLLAHSSIAHFIKKTVTTPQLFDHCPRPANPYLYIPCPFLPSFANDPTLPPPLRSRLLTHTTLPTFNNVARADISLHILPFDRPLFCYHVLLLLLTTLDDPYCTHQNTNTNTKKSNNIPSCTSSWSLLDIAAENKSKSQKKTDASKKARAHQFHA